MSLISSIRSNNKIMAGVAVAALVVAGIAYGLGRSHVPSPVKEGYFTVDDGKTTFVDSLTKAPPFEHDGATAYRAVMFNRHGGGGMFLGYLLRFTPEGQADYTRLIQKYKMDGAGARLADVYLDETEVKRPGDSKWVAASSAEGQAIMDVKSPDGTPDPAIALP